MSPSAVPGSTTLRAFSDDLNLSIVGLGVEYPAFHNGPEALETLARRHYPDSTALNKVLSINQFTGIEKRSAIGDADHPVVNQSRPPSIKELHDLFMDEGVRLSVAAGEKALNEWGGSASEITHVVSTTCTNSANPGFDHFVAKKLGIPHTSEKVLLHGVGCSGGMAALRTAANLALGSSYQQRPARILVLACEISSVLVRSELESIHENQEVRIGVCLFSDCASACVLSNNLGKDTYPASQAPYSLLGWRHELLPETHQDLGFDVDPMGWKVVLTPSVPAITSAAVPEAFRGLVASIPALRTNCMDPVAADFDWALHPGGSTIITGVQTVLGISEDHLRASYGVYVEHGNSSSATIFSVLQRLREEGGVSGRSGRENVIALAFGPGICLEMMALKKGEPRLEGGLMTEDLD